ncbi:MAG: type III pantothenate kinase [Candidatus Omnitrophota bacterium]
MILTIDIGNTSITAGLFKGSRLLKRFSTPTLRHKFPPFLFFVAKDPVTAVIIASVVPRAADNMIKSLKSAFPRIKPVVLGENARVPIKNLYKFPKQVGQDRLINAYAAVNLYGYPAVVVDFGTAITFDVISARKEYKGGLILPGLQTSLDALSEKTALLPKVSVTKPASLVGRDTKNSMLSGIIYGYASMTDCLTKKLAHKSTKRPAIIGTGGHINLIAPYCTCFTAIDPDLTLKGLNLLS